MKHGWRPPAFSYDGSSGGPDNRWIEFVNDTHLLWLMEWVPIRTGPSGQEGQLAYGHGMDTDEVECFYIIKEQAEELMLRPDAEHWTAEACSKRRQEALYGKYGKAERQAEANMAGQ